MTWEKYYEKNQGRALRPLYSQAIAYLSPFAKRATDLGCGLGTEVFDLLNRGLEVYAIDQEPKSIELVSFQIELHRDRLHPYLSSLEKWDLWPAVDFLFAYHSLPFCAEDPFHFIIEKALSSIMPQGIFAAGFFGPEDDWVIDKKATGISLGQIESKLSGFEILKLEEIKKLAPSALSGEKNWNVIDVIARRI